MSLFKSPYNSIYWLYFSKEKVREPPGSSVSSGGSSPRSGSLIEQNIVAFPTSTSSSDNSKGVKSEGPEKSPEFLPSETSDDKAADQKREDDKRTVTDQEIKSMEEGGEENLSSSSQVVENEKKVEEIKIDGKDINDEEKSKQVEDNKLENVTEPGKEKPETTSQQNNEDILKFSCIIASVDEQQTNQQETSVPPSRVPPAEAEEDSTSCHEPKTSGNQESVENCELESSVKSIDNLAAAQTDSVESSEVEMVIDQKREATLTSDSLEIIEPNNVHAEINDASLPSKNNSDPGAACDESENITKSNVALDQPQTAEQPDGTEELSGDCMETCNGSSEKCDPISLSQQSVEFIDETSHDCMITSVKPSNVQYVEITLGSAKTDISQLSLSKDHMNKSDHLTKSDKLPDTFQNADTTEVTNICDPPATLSSPKQPKRATLQSLSSPKTESDEKPDSGKRRLSLKAAPGAVRIPACFKMDAQPTSSLITISDSEEEIDPKEESESEGLRLKLVLNFDLFRQNRLRW